MLRAARLVPDGTDTSRPLPGELNRTDAQQKPGEPSLGPPRTAARSREARAQDIALATLPHLPGAAPGRNDPHARCAPSRRNARFANAPNVVPPWDGPLPRSRAGGTHGFERDAAIARSARRCSAPAPEPQGTRAVEGHVPRSAAPRPAPPRSRAVTSSAAVRVPAFRCDHERASKRSRPSAVLRCALRHAARGQAASGTYRIEDRLPGGIACSTFSSQ